tara:strand:- start:91 stop:624 length:534 start_codon:yes stop_codon:yes gene_type:complete
MSKLQPKYNEDGIPYAVYWKDVCLEDWIVYINRPDVKKKITKNEKIGCCMNNLREYVPKSISNISALYLWAYVTGYLPNLYGMGYYHYFTADNHSIKKYNKPEITKEQYEILIDVYRKYFEQFSTTNQIEEGIIEIDQARNTEDGLIEILSELVPNTDFSFLFTNDDSRRQYRYENA